MLWSSWSLKPQWSGLLDENNDTSDLELEPELSEISSIGGSVDPGSSFRIFTLFLLTNLLQDKLKSSQAGGKVVVVSSGTNTIKLFADDPDDLWLN